MAMLKPRLATGGQEYGLASEYAKRIGRSLNTVKDWLRNLEAKDMIHPIQGAPNVHPMCTLVYTHATTAILTPTRQKTRCKGVISSTARYLD